MPPRKTLVVPSEQRFILVTQPSAYAEQYDIIAAINGSPSIACMTLSPEKRDYRKIKGVNQLVVNQRISNTLAPAINRLHVENICLICDQSRAHNKADMPTAFAKYLSPLDSPLWHSIKEFVRNRHPLSTADIPLLLSEAFYSLSKKEIQNAHRKCSFIDERDEYYDRP